jgi:hypothetical protein
MGMSKPLLKSLFSPSISQFNRLAQGYSNRVQAIVIMGLFHRSKSRAKAGG